jgi:hypothetical protein
MQSIIERRLIILYFHRTPLARLRNKDGQEKGGTTASASLRHRRAQHCSNECYDSFDKGDTVEKQTVLRAYGSEFVEVQETVAIFVGLLHSTPQLRAAPVH